MAKIYLRNKDLLEEVRISKANNKMTDNLIQMFMLLSKRLISKMSYADDFLREEAESGALLDMITYWDRFDETKSANGFGYYTSIGKNGAAKAFNKVYKYGKKFKGVFISLNGSASSDDYDTSIYSI